MTTQDALLLAALLCLGPWGVVLALALLRGYSLTILLTRDGRRRRKRARQPEAD